MCVYDDKGQTSKQSLLMSLLQKAAQDKKFVADEAQGTLRTMSQELSPLPLIKIIHPCLYNTNPRIRCVSTVHIATIASRLSADDIKSFGFTELVRCSGKLLTDKLPDTRAAARTLIEQMHALYIVDPAIATQEMGTSTSVHAAASTEGGGGGATAPDQMEKEEGGGEDHAGRLMSASSTVTAKQLEMTADEMWSDFLRQNVDATTAQSVLRITGNMQRRQPAFATI